MSKVPAAAAPTAARKEQQESKWRRRSLVRVRRPSWATVDQRPRKA